MNNPETRPLDTKQIQINAGHILTELKGLQENLKQQEIIKDIQDSAKELQTNVVENNRESFPLRTEQGAKQFLSLVKNLSFKELYGSSGESHGLNVAVTMAVQTLLLNNGFYQNNDADIHEADGILGSRQNSKTKNAVKAFQKEWNVTHTPRLTQDGIPGPATIKALLKYVDKNGTSELSGEEQKKSEGGKELNNKVDSKDQNLDNKEAFYSTWDNAYVVDVQNNKKYDLEAIKNYVNDYGNFKYTIYNTIRSLYEFPSCDDGYKKQAGEIFKEIKAIEQKIIDQYETDDLKNLEFINNEKFELYMAAVIAKSASYEFPEGVSNIPESINEIPIAPYNKEKFLKIFDGITVNEQ